MRKRKDKPSFITKCSLVAKRKRWHFYTSGDIQYKLAYVLLIDTNQNKTAHSLFSSMILTIRLWKRDRQKGEDGEWAIPFTKDTCTGWSRKKGRDIGGRGECRGSGKEGAKELLKWSSIGSISTNSGGIPERAGTLEEGGPARLHIQSPTSGGRLGQTSLLWDHLRGEEYPTEETNRSRTV